MKRKYKEELQIKLDDINRNIREDDLWMGRFEGIITDSYFEEYEDGSGGMLTAAIRFVDKATGYYRDFTIDYAPYLPFTDFRIWEMANNFIADYSDVYLEKPGPGAEGFVKDYTNVPVNKAILEEPWNDFMPYRYWVKQ